MTSRHRIVLAAALDAGSVVLFVALGRGSHDEGSAISGTLEVAAPFLIGLLAAWLLVRAWHRPMSISAGVEIWPVTVLVGMALRNLVFDRGTAVSFVIVATIVLGVLLVGWRCAAHLVARKRQNSTAAAGTS